VRARHPEEHGVLGNRRAGKYSQIAKKLDRFTNGEKLFIIIKWYSFSGTFRQMIADDGAVLRSQVLSGNRHLRQ